MDLLLSVAILLLVLAVAALLLARVGKARHERGIAQQYGAAPRTTDAELHDAREHLAGDLAELLKKKAAKDSF